MPQKIFQIIKISLLAAVLILATCLPSSTALSASCKDVNIVFARGSGEELGATNYQSFKTELSALLGDIDYSFYELGSQKIDGSSYPAIDLTFGHSGAIINSITAKISSGESFAFGNSVNSGVNELKSYITRTLSTCPQSKFVLAGYSQGATVMSKAIRSLDSSHIIYIATFGDPKLYLPEGYGSVPEACSNPDSLSSYREYVPDCKAYQGILDGYQPYQPNDSYEGKIGVWCNYHDIMCSSKIDWSNIMGAHTSYVSDHRYSDAAKVIAKKIYQSIGQDYDSNTSASTHDVAFLIDTTGSMASYIEDYRNQALRLATNVLAKGGRVALYEYRDLSDPFETRQLCSFETCDLTTFAEKLASLETDGGGDAPESLLSASLKTMNSLRWQIGANKTIIALTDAGTINPDHDGTTLSQVISRSLEIDPVHIYIITPYAEDASLQALATNTGGQVFDINSDLELSTDTISNLDPETTVFYDGNPVQLTTINNLKYHISDNILSVSFETDAYQSLIIINETIYGFTDQTTLEISDLDFSQDNLITIVPFSTSGDRGETADLLIEATNESKNPLAKPGISSEDIPSIDIPNAGFPENH